MEQIKNTINNIIGCLAKETANMAMLNSEEFKNACDGVKDLAMTDYYCTITKAMEDPGNVYGEDWNENGPMKKGYSNGNMSGYSQPMPMHKGYENYNMMPNQMRDYSNGMNNNNNSRYERARRGYEETKDINSLNHLFDIIEADVKELKPSMTIQDKQTAHQRLSNLADMMTSVSM